MKRCVDTITYIDIEYFYDVVSYGVLRIITQEVFL
jgi:hypothetical protein